MKLHVDLTEWWPVPEIREDGSPSAFLVEMPEDEAAEWQRLMNEARRNTRAFLKRVRELDTESESDAMRRRHEARERQKADDPYLKPKEPKPARAGCTLPSSKRAP